MKHRTLRGLQFLLGLLLFAAGSGQPAGFDLVVQQIEFMGARQWFGVMAGSVIGPVSQRVTNGFPQWVATTDGESTLKANTA